MIEKSEGEMLRLESPPNKAIKVSLSASGRTEPDTTGTERSEAAGHGSLSNVNHQPRCFLASTGSKIC